MTSPLRGPLAKTIGRALQSVMYPLTLKRVTIEYELGQDPVEMIEEWSCRGMVEDFDAMALQRAQAYADGSIISLGDRKFTILAASLDTKPKPLDFILLDGTEYTVRSVVTDPAGATWTLVAG